MSELEQATATPGPIPETFTLKEKLGATSACETWLAFDRIKKRRLILKQYHRDYFRNACSSLDIGKLSSIFLADCAVYESLELKEPEAVLKIVAYGSDEKIIWVARENSGDKPSLKEWRAAGKPPQLTEILKRFASISSTLGNLHQLNQVHRSVHPGNIFIVGPSNCVLTDPDLGHFLEPGFHGVPLDAKVFGKFDYLSPEQKAENVHKLDFRTDIWSLGATLIFALSGKSPSEVDISTLPVETHGLLAKMLQTDPEQRFASMNEVREELVRLQKSNRPSMSLFEDSEPQIESPSVLGSGPSGESAPLIAPESAVVPSMSEEPAATSPQLAGTISQEPVCPQCGTPVVATLRHCPRCNRGYDEPCLNCQSFNPFWLKQCRGCHGDIASLKQKMVEKLYAQQQQILKLREIYMHEKAQVLVKIMSQITHPDFHAYREWAKNLLPTIQKERRDIRNYIEGIRVQSKQAMHEQQYERVQQIIEQVPQTLLDEELRKMHAEAGECITEVESLIREIRNAIVTKKFNTLLSTVQRYLELKANDPEARTLQEKIEKLTTVTSPTGAKLRRIPPGKFYMGSHESDVFIRNNERPQHRVMITKPCLIGVYPVTQEEFLRIMEFNPGIASDDPQCPIDNVTWFTAIEYCNKLSVEENLPPYYEMENAKRRATGMIERADVKILGGEGYRLPTEAEWEYSCRAGSITPWNFGDLVVEVTHYAWYFDNAQNETHPVGKKKPNSWGLYDMHGNLLEWCWDWYGEFYYQQCNDIEDPQGPDNGTSRVLRGGAWQFGAEATRSPYRNNSNPESNSSVVGFRIMRNIAEDSPETKPATSPEQPPAT